MKILKLHLFLYPAILLTACSGTSTPPGKTGMIVNVAEVRNGNASQQKEFPFISKPFRTSELSFRVGGQVQRFDVYAGNRYRKGEQIAGIDPRDFLIRKERAEAVMQQTKAEYERVEKLYQKNNVSASTYEKAKTDYTTARTAFETASNELADTRLTAPFDGYAGEVYIEKHQDVRASQPVVTLVDIDRLKIEVYVTQEIAFHARELAYLGVRFDLIPGKNFAARVVEVAKSPTANNLSYLMTAVVDNQKGELLAGMSGKAFFNLHNQGTPQGTVIPQSALCHRPSEGDYVWTVEKLTGHVSQRKVVTDVFLPGGMVAVANGLEEGELVAVSGMKFLTDGMQVAINKQPAR